MPRLTAVLQPLQRDPAPLRRQITAEIRHSIEAGDLKPGERLTEKALCEGLNVSRTSLREALRELEVEGLVATNPSRGLVVAQITREEAENIYRVRAALEPLAAEQFARNPAPGALVRFERAVKQLRGAYGAKDLVAILRAKKELYAELCAGAGNSIVLEILSRLNARIGQLRSTSLVKPARPKASMAEIEALLAALKAGDPAAARAAAERHVLNAAEAALGGKLNIAAEAQTGPVLTEPAKRKRPRAQETGARGTGSR